MFIDNMYFWQVEKQTPCQFIHFCQHGQSVLTVPTVFLKKKKKHKKKRKCNCFFKIKKLTFNFVYRKMHV